jgi:hypothetical protein
VTILYRFAGYLCCRVIGASRPLWPLSDSPFGRDGIEAARPLPKPRKALLQSEGGAPLSASICSTTELPRRHLCGG